MTEQQINPNTSKSKSLMFFEYVLFGLCLSVIVLRTTFTEGPTVKSTAMSSNVGDSLYSLSVSSVLILAFVMWVVWSFYTGRFVYRFTGMEIGLCLFGLAALVSGFAATDKRLAITDIAVFLAPLLTAVLLVQILDSHIKIKLLLVVIVAVGVLSVYQCIEQFVTGNQVMIEQYEQDPQSMLAPLGVETGTLQHFLFEHRLYTRGVRASFTTRNSAGSFLLIAFFAAIALFINFSKNRESKLSRRRNLFACVFAGVFILLGLLLTRSKGAIIGLLFAGMIFVIYLGLGRRLKNFTRIVLIAFILLVIAGVLIIARYGLEYDHLPGGSSMLVRWQYWHAAAKMYADHPLTGVGPGNFSDFYPHYKPPEALESVSDPHNFPLSILTQYGPLGLVAFIVMIFVPMWRMSASPGTTKDLHQNIQVEPTYRVMAKILLIVISVLLFVTRFLSMPVSMADMAVAIYVVIRFYVPPVVVFIIGYLYLTDKLKDITGKQSEIRNETIAVVLFCSVLGVLVHNLIDFAIFEPGVFTLFWAVVACLVAINSFRNPQPCLVLKSKTFHKVLVTGISLVVIWMFFAFALVPVAKSTVGIMKANQAITLGRFDEAHTILDRAAADDSLSSAALSLNGRLYMSHFSLTQDQDTGLLIKAEDCFRAAIKRNNVAYNNFERLTDVYCRLAEVSTSPEKADWLKKAFDTAILAVERYPGCDRLHFKLAEIAEQSGKKEIAAEQYKLAIDIEDKFRRQFRQIYPERGKIISRLGEEKYRLAKQRLEFLTQQSLQ